MKKYSLYIATISMILTIVGILVQSGSFVQSMFFFLGAVGLLYSSILQQYKVFIYLELVVVIGGFLGFFNFIPNIYKYIILAVLRLVIIYLVIKNNILKTERYSIFGILGLSILAMGFATNPAENVLYFYRLLIIGSVLMAIYSIFGIILEKDKLAWIFFILNMLFLIGPIKVLYF